MALTPDDKFLLSCSNGPANRSDQEQSFKIFDFETKQQVLGQSLEGKITSMTLTTDNKFIIFGFQKAKIRMIPLEPMKEALGKFLKSLKGFIFFRFSKCSHSFFKRRLICFNIHLQPEPLFQ